MSLRPVVSDALPGAGSAESSDDWEAEREH
jgi:hypothetical protein